MLLLADPAPKPEPPRATPVFELVVPRETIVCGVFSVAGADRGPSDERLLKSRVTLPAGTTSLPTAEDVFEAELFERVTFGPAGDEVQPVAPRSFHVRRLAAIDDVTTYQFTYAQEFVLPDQRTLEVAIVSPLQYRARGEEPLERAQPLPEAFFVALKGREALQGNIDRLPTLRYGSCGYDSLTRWDVEFQLADGNSFRLREYYDEAESEFDTAPATLRSANVVLGEERRTVADYFDLVYSAFRHNTKITYWVILDPPVRLGEHELGGVELKAPGLPDRPKPEATYLDTRLEPLEIVAVTEFRREPLTRVAFRRGDADADGQLTVLDARTILDLLFERSMPLVCAQAADANDNGRISIVDAIVAIGALFGRDPLPSPFPACGTDPTQPALGCDSYNPCE